MKTLILRVALRILVPLSLVFAVFVFFKGHQTPGGGFVGGLVAAVAMIVFQMGEGRDKLEAVLPFPERLFIAIGLTLALGTGIFALAGGLPFLTSNFGYIPLPGGAGATFEWATVMFFDAGVFMVVAGVVVGMINALTKELDQS